MLTAEAPAGQLKRLKYRGQLLAVLHAFESQQHAVVRRFGLTIAGPHDQHRNLGRMDDGPRHASQQQAFKTAQSPRADDDQIALALVGRLQDPFPWIRGAEVPSVLFGRHAAGR